MYENKFTQVNMVSEGGMSRIAYLGTNTIRYILNLYCMQFMSLCAEFQTKTNFTISDTAFFLQSQTILRSKITQLRKMLLYEECKPPLARCRDYDWLIEKEMVMCFVPDNDKLFVKACVCDTNVILCDGGRAVSVKYSERVNRQYFMSGLGGIYGVADPYILKKWEYKYLINNLEFAHLWIEQCIQGKYSLQDAILFLQAL